MRRCRRALAGALLVVVAGLSLGGTVRAQEPGSLAAQFGGLTASGRANGIQFTYDVENVFPLPPPLFQASIPEASASLQSGPSATALGSVAYPGNVVANLPAVVAQASPEAGPFVPPYPVLARADHPAGPPEARQDVGTATATVTATDSLAQAVTTMAGGELPPFARVGAVTTSARTEIVQGAIESRSRIELTGVDLLFGLVHIDSLVTDLVGTTDGTTAASDGGTTATGVTFLGVPATLGPGGLEVASPSAPADPGPLGPLVDGLGDLGPAAAGAAAAVAPLDQAFQQVLGTTDAGVNELLAAAGITIRTLAPFETVDGPSVDRTANGLVVDIRYDGRGDNPLAQLLAAIPSENLPGESLHPAIPLNTSPQALVNLLKETHVTGLALAYGNVSLNATPAFEFTPPPFTPAGGAGGSGVLGPLGGGSGGSPGGTVPGFSTPAPALPSGDGGGFDGTPAVAIGGAGAGAAVVLALVTSPVWAVGARNLADNVLGMAGSSCPEGRDRLPKEA